jgi:alkanesulfonate monooxygenase SsuD/methylene tetrahydromethanopterin reductase-like flavin-dependent oxidoreductase (luciferase family)
LINQLTNDGCPRPGGTTPDYGHDLAFDTFITPDAAHPQRVIELGRLTEEVGLDLATFQDHPYQARHLDAWALAATVAASTTTLRVTANVTNLPLRPPYVIAKNVASLDLLSGGRVELGIGAGAFWDAIAAAGEPRRTAGQALAALDEAIAIIRAAWDTSSSAVRVRGEYYHVDGIHTGPAPAHDIEIWVGAVGPRMLALTGRAGDGWLPSEAYVPPDKLADGNARIDDAAQAAGREPGRIRRLYNINPSGDPAWASRLADLAVEHGISTFIVPGDDPDLVRRFAAEVAPAVRELVDKARAGRALSGGLQGSCENPAAPGTEAGAKSVAPVAARPARGNPVPYTPDSGIRRSAHAAWDETTRPVHISRQPPLEWTARQRSSANCRLVTLHHTVEDSSTTPWRT